MFIVYWNRHVTCSILGITHARGRSISNCHLIGDLPFMSSAVDVWSPVILASRSSSIPEMCWFHFLLRCLIYLTMSSTFTTFFDLYYWSNICFIYFTFEVGFLSDILTDALTTSIILSMMLLNGVGLRLSACRIPKEVTVFFASALYIFICVLLPVLTAFRVSTRSFGMFLFFRVSRASFSWIPSKTFLNLWNSYMEMWTTLELYLLFILQ